ncbi:hypothetical protein [Bradyrhizobium uaiense]|nr:hypothetical protein [Bradyrhizobium uaiense]
MSENNWLLFFKFQNRSIRITKVSRRAALRHSKIPSSERNPSKVI